MLAAGADPHSRDLAGRTPLHRVLFSNIDLVQVLLSAGADINAKDYGGRTILFDCAGGQEPRTLPWI